jgi:hypothetical protein
MSDIKPPVATPPAEAENATAAVLAPLSAAEASEKLLHAARTANAIELAFWIETGANVNVQDDELMTPLHHAAAMGARPCIRLLVKTGRCDYLLKDKYGRYASELAYEWGRDFGVGRLLSKKQARQAYEQRGVAGQ